MIKKICNWTFGGFFRTLGRTFAFILLGALFAIIAFKNGLNLDKLLGIDSVNAATGSITSYNWRARYYSFPPPGSGDYGLGDWCSFINGHTPCWPGENDTGYIAGFAFRGYYSGGYKNGNAYTFKYSMNTSNKTEILNNLGDINANISNKGLWVANGEYEGFSKRDVIPSVRIENSPSANELYVYVSFISDIDFKSFSVAFDFNNGLYFGSVDWVSVYQVSVTYSEGVGAQIDNQTNIMNENQQTIINNINNTNDTLNNSNVDEATSSASNFFSNFTSEDIGGLTSIITAPLNSIRAMLSDTCTAPSTTYKGKTISLPCGDMLWSRPGANGLKNFLNLVYGGLISYGLIASLFKLVEQFKNPESDKIEVIDL